MSTKHAHRGAWWIASAIVVSSCTSEPRATGEAELSAESTFLHSGSFDEAGVEETLVRVRILASETGEPVAGVRLGLARERRERTPQRGLVFSSVETVDGPRATPPQVPLTDANGICEFVVEPGYGYRTVACYVEPRIGWGRQVDVDALAPGEVRELEMRVATRNDILFHGRLIDDETGDAIEGATVSACGARGDTQATSDAQGRFVVRAASWQTPEASVHALGYGPWLFTLDRTHALPERALDIPLTRAGTLVVQLRGTQAGERYEVEVRSDRAVWFDHGQPIEPDRSTTWSTRADSKGRAVIEGLPAGAPLQIAVREGRTATWKERKPVVLSPGERLDVAVGLRSGAAVRGRLVDGEGRPIAGHVVRAAEAWIDGPHFLSWSDRARAECTTDDDGRFDLGELEPGGWWVGPAPDNAFNPPAIPSDVPTLAEHVMVQRGGSDRELVLARPRGLRIRGRVVGVGGQPVTRVLVTAQCELGYVSATPDESGGFDLAPLVEARWMLQASCGEPFIAPSLEVPASVGESDVRLQMRPGGAISATVKCADGTAPIEGEVFLARSGVKGCVMLPFLVDGHIDSRGLEPDDYSLSVVTKAGEYALVERIAVHAGPPAIELDLELRQGAWLVLSAPASERGIGVEIRQDGVIAFVGSCRGTREIVVPSGPIALSWNSGSPREQRASLDLAPGERRTFVLAD